MRGCGTLLVRLRQLRHLKWFIAVRNDLSNAWAVPLSRNRLSFFAWRGNALFGSAWLRDKACSGAATRHR